MCEILLVRHAHCPEIECYLFGRTSAVRLSALGKSQAKSLALCLDQEPVACVQSSPQARCIETAEALAALFQLPVEVESELDEIDFGDWTGYSFASLHADPKWHQWNLRRETARAPGGESMAEAQERIVSHLERTLRNNQEGSVVMITHAELVRAAVLKILGRPLSDWHIIRAEPASITRIGHAERNTLQAICRVAA